MEAQTISKKNFNSKLFQKCKGFMFMFVCLPSMFAGMQIMSSVFTLFIPKYRCSIPFFTNDTFETQGRRHEVFVNKTIPMVVEGDGMSAYSQCEIYKTSLNTSYSALKMPPSNTSTEQCNKWVYDSSVLKDTFITQANLVCKREIARANANMIYFSGMMTGALVIGLLSDRFGRKKVLIISTLMHVGGAFGSAFATDYIFFVAMRFIIGVSCTGMYTSSFVLGMELVIPSKRVAASYMLDMAWCVGLYILCFLAYVTRSWDMILLVMASLTMLLFVCLWIIPESPRWLKSKCRFIEANAIILEWENINGEKALTDTSSKNTKDDVEPESVLKMCTIPNLLIRTLLIYLNWFVIIMVNLGISLNVGNMDGDLFVNFAIISSMEMLAYTFCFLLLNKTGRKRLLVGTLFLCGGACILSVFVMLFFNKSLYWITLVLSYIGKFGITASHSIIYVWSAELFPTKVRNSGIGTSSVVGFAGSMTSPYISDLGKYVHGSFGEVLPQIIFGACSVIAGMTSLLLPETNGKPLPETVFDAVQFGKKKADDRNSRSTVFHTDDAFNKDERTGEV